MGSLTKTHRPEWSLCDPLGEALQHLRMDGLFYCHSEVTEPWGMDLPPMDNMMMFHVVVSGRSWLEVSGSESCELLPGEFALLPHGEGHRLGSGKDVDFVDLFSLERTVLTDRYEVIHYGGEGESTTMICGAVRFKHPAATQLVKMLPSLIHIKSWEKTQDEWIQSTLKLLAMETKNMRPGGDAVITRVSDILVIQALRRWMESDAKAKRGWLGALQDPRVGLAMAMMHREPKKDWSVASLATEVAMSRSGFAARFRELVGESPMRYLTRWRMQVAWGQLQDNKQISLGELAEEMGYQSEAAFSRAFKRYVGISPGAARKATL